MLTVTSEVSAYGYHAWPDAPQHRAYLRTPHPHSFVIRVTVRVDGDNRVVEFHDLADEILMELDKYFKPAIEEDVAYDFRTNSCEQLADFIAHTLSYDVVRVTVSEDGTHAGGWLA